MMQKYQRLSEIAIPAIKEDMPMSATFDDKQLLDSLTTAVILVDESLRILRVNTAAESLLEISANRATATPIYHYFSESAQALEKIESALLFKEQFTKRKAQWHLHTNKHITVDYTVTPLVDSHQLLFEIQAQDRLLKISKEEALIASQETTRNLIRGLAHEVKNPLGGIRGAAQLLDSELNTDELKEYTHIIISESDRLRNLVDRMLGPRNTPEFDIINIHQVMEHVVKVAEAEAAGNITFLRNYDPSIPEIKADFDLLVQALLNIVRNAMQALTEQQASTQVPTIALNTRIKRHFTIGRKHYPLVACMTVEDNGPGIPQHLVNDIFYPMISGRAAGSGLGLAIAQQLITQNHGLIECDSQPGQTIFSIYIPLEEHHD